jgi:acyl carrier protein
LTLIVTVLRIDAKPEGKPTMLRAVGEARLIAIMRDTFDDDELVYRDDLTADDVIGWDSLSHVPFLATVEKSFGFRFTSAEIDSLKNIGELLDVILRRATI